MGIFSDKDEAFDLFVLNELSKQNRQPGGCMLSLLVILGVPALAIGLAAARFLM